MSNSQEFVNAFLFSALFLTSIIFLLLFILFLWWLITISFETKNNYIENFKSTRKDLTLKQKKFIFRITQYKPLKKELILNARDTEVTTSWNCYRNVLSAVLISRKDQKRKTSISLFFLTVSFYLIVLSILVTAIIYYVAYLQGKIESLNLEAIGIVALINLVLLVLTWLFWTMNYEQIRKEMIDLSKIIKLQPKVQTKIKWLSHLKTFVPGSELLW